MLVIGLTGGIGSGKSAVSGYFSALGVPIIDTDLIAREVVEPDKPALKKIRTVFSSAVIDQNGHLDRAKLRDIIFKDDGKRNKLEQILHPIIKETVHERISTLQADYCIVVVPLLVESGWLDLVHRVLTVDVPTQIQKQRVLMRDNISSQQLTAILNRQIKREARLEAADDVIDNSGSIPALKAQVEQLHQKYCALSKHTNETPNV